MLGPRSIIELSMYLKNIYQEEIPDCKFCSNIVVKVSKPVSDHRKANRRHFVLLCSLVHRKLCTFYV